MNEEAYAIHAFITSKEGKELCDPSLLKDPEANSKYLSNRIRTAFQEGMATGMQLQLKRDKERLASLL